MMNESCLIGIATGPGSHDAKPGKQVGVINQPPGEYVQRSVSEHLNAGRVLLFYVDHITIHEPKEAE
jgi:hypothetical protein